MPSLGAQSKDFPTQAFGKLFSPISVCALESRLLPLFQACDPIPNNFVWLACLFMSRLIASLSSSLFASLAPSPSPACAGFSINMAYNQPGYGGPPPPGYGQPYPQPGYGGPPPPGYGGPPPPGYGGPPPPGYGQPYPPQQQVVVVSLRPDFSVGLFDCCGACGRRALREFCYPFHLKFFRVGPLTHVFHSNP